METSDCPPWLLLPGHLCDARMWISLRSTLTAAGAEALDADLTRDDTVNGMARRALDEHGGPTVLVGFSMGGMVALRMAALAPERVVGMVLVDTNAAPDLPERSIARIEQQAEARAGRLHRVVVDSLVPHYLSPANRGRRDLTDLITDMADDAGPDTFVRQSEAIRLRPDARPTLKDVQCPVLVAAGEEDVLCPPDWQRFLAAALPQSQLRLVKDAGHFMPIEQPDVLSSVVTLWGAAHKFLNATA
jgi:pimeloyl-ACP methyl ester carboxylesterase